MNNITNNDLFKVTTPYLKDLFDNHCYPWEILPNIKNHVDFLFKNIPTGFKLLKEGILVGENVTISDQAIIIPPIIIGPNTEIRPGAYLRGNVITGSNCVIGNSSELKNCILLDNVQIPHYNYVGDSILGNNSHLGAGTVCSNLKSDKSNVVIHADTNFTTNLRKIGAILGDNVEVGCNSVLNPGTIIGKNTRVYPLTSLRGVIPNDKIVKSANKIVEII